MKSHQAFALLLISLTATGCGRAGGNTVAAKGQVTIAGTPTADLTVTFYPEKGRPAIGVTDAQGNFVLSTFGAADGALVGNHKVAITKAGAAASLESMPGMSGTASSAATPPPFDAKYQNPETSGLSAVVKKGEANNFPFELK